MLAMLQMKLFYTIVSKPIKSQQCPEFLNLFSDAMSTISINHFKPFEPFEDDLIRKYLYHSYPLTADGTVDLYSCFASCKLDVNSCMVVVVHDDICYLGNFEQDNRGIISTALFEEVYVNAGDGECFNVNMTLLSIVIVNRCSAENVSGSEPLQCKYQGL